MMRPQHARTCRRRSRPTSSTWRPDDLEPPHACRPRPPRPGCRRPAAGRVGVGLERRHHLGEGVADQEPQLHPLRVRCGADPAVEGAEGLGEPVGHVDPVLQPLPGQHPHRDLVHPPVAPDPTAAAGRSRCRGVPWSGRWCPSPPPTAADTPTTRATTPAPGSTPGVRKRPASATATPPARQPGRRARRGAGRDGPAASRPRTRP